MEASVLRESGSATLLKDPRAGFLRLQSDERLVSLTRRGNEAAFETLIARYRVRLLAFCRHMVGSTEDAEDILQEVFVSAYRAMLADDRELNVRPWLYRIARNRSLNHLRRPRPTGMDSMDVFEGGAAVATADRVHDKLDLEDLVEDVKKLPETQRTALMLREMGDLSYDQIAEAMDTSIPSVKSLLVRARVSLAEAAESRRLSCDEVRMELGAVAEGLQKLSSPARRHVADCDRCRSFKKELTLTNRKLAVLAPVGGILALKSLLALKLFGGATAGGTSAAGGAAGGVGAATGAGGAAAAGSAAVGGAAASSGAAAGVSAGLGAVAAKVGVGLAAAALVTGGVAQVAKTDSTATTAQAPSISKPATEPQGTGGVAPGALAEDNAAVDPTAATGEPETSPTDAVSKPDEPVVSDPTAATGKPDKPAEVVDEESTTVVLPGGGREPSTPTGGGGSSAETPGLPTSPNDAPPADPAPVAGTSSATPVGPTSNSASNLSNATAPGAAAGPDLAPAS
jgi:RNA polymerase sigma factor (sigma-70 family)